MKKLIDYGDSAFNSIGRRVITVTVQLIPSDVGNELSTLSCLDGALLARG